MNPSFVALKGIRAEKARRSLLEFVKQTFPGPGVFEAGWFASELCAHLEKFYKDVEDGLSPRMAVFAPPRHGKSQIVSRGLPPWLFGKDPNLTVIATSHTAGLASDMNRDCQRLIDSEVYQSIFPQTKLYGKNIRGAAKGSFLRNSDVFEIVNHTGRYKCAGVGGAITGCGGHVLIIDDPIVDAEQAYSETYRKKLWDWYTSTLYTRCMPGGGILLIQTRWHSDDLAGRLLEAMKKEQGDTWNVINFPAIAEKDEYSTIDGRLLRREGEALHPERWSIDRLDRIKSATEHCGVWASLYQQRPSAAEGVIFKRADWHWWQPKQSLRSMDDQQRKMTLRELGIFQVIQSWDIAIGGKEKNDFTACTTLGVAENKYFVLDVWKAQCEYPEAKLQVQLLYDKWRPHVVTVEGGGASGGKSIIQELRRMTRVPFKETTTSQDKVMRARLISPNHSAKLCWLPQGEPWSADFYENCSAFPASAHDDDVDSFIMALEEATGGKRKLQISDEVINMFK